MSRHNSAFYREYRPFYPAATFRGFQESLVQCGALKPFVIADVGCGTGHSVVSLLRTDIQAQVIGVDPDPEMIAQAKRMVAESDYQVEFRQGTGERTGLASRSVDGIVVGSAFHWMEPDQARQEFKRVLRPKGVVRIFEYQFPKALDLPVLNEWIRRQFNLHWKAPLQEPRGTFKELTQGFHRDPDFSFSSEAHPKMILSLNANELTGLILSQSRVLHFENSLNDSEKWTFREEILEVITREMNREIRHDFDFKLSWIEFLQRIH